MVIPAGIHTIGAPPASILVTYNAMNEQFRQAEETDVAGRVGDGTGVGAGRPAGRAAGRPAGRLPSMVDGHGQR